MAKNKLIILLTLGVWLINYLVCFCDGEDDFNQPVNSYWAYFLNSYSDKESNSGSENSHFCCTNCCGHQVFIPITNESSFLTKPPILLFKTLNSFFADQLYLGSIFHPPKA